MPLLTARSFPLMDDAILPFSELQKRLGRKNVGTQLLTAVPVVLVAYDLFTRRQSFD